MERKRKTKRFSDLVQRLDIEPISVMIFNETIMEQFDVRWEGWYINFNSDWSFWAIFAIELRVYESSLRVLPLNGTTDPITNGPLVMGH